MIWKLCGIGIQTCGIQMGKVARGMLACQPGFPLHMHMLWLTMAYQHVLLPRHLLFPFFIFHLAQFQT